MPWLKAGRRNCARVPLWLQRTFPESVARWLGFRALIDTVTGGRTKVFDKATTFRFSLVIAYGLAVGVRWGTGKGLDGDQIG